MKIKRSYFSFIVIFLIIFGLSAPGRSQELKKKPRPEVSALTYLNGGYIGNGDTISVLKFDSLLTKPLVVRDSIGRMFPVLSYNFIYAKRGLYSDSTGRPVISCDYIGTSSDGGRLPYHWENAFLPQVKGGDTAIFTDIRFRADTAVNTPLLYGKTFRVILSGD